MNVAFDPWIPVVDLHGKYRRISPLQVFTEGDKYSDFAVRPHERVALMRLIICIAHACINGPENKSDWEKIPEKLPKMAERYLTEWKDSFEVFHPNKPWLQIPDIKPVKGDGWISVSKLAFFMASGNNSTLFDHDGMYELRHVEICDTLVSMLAFQCFSPGGTISKVHWLGEPTKDKSEDAPCVSSSMLHTLIRRSDLSKTLQANIPTYSRVRRLMGMHMVDPIGRPVWEQMPKSLQDEATILNATRTYLGRLTPLKRLILLNGKDNAKTMIFGDGLYYPSFRKDNFPPESTATVIRKINKKKETRELLAYSTDKGTWRDLPAILAKLTGESSGIGSPLAIDFLQENEDANCDLIVSGVARNKAKVIYTSESVYLVPSSWRLPGGLDSFEHEISRAEDLAANLRRAVEIYRKAIDPGWEKRLEEDRKARNKLFATPMTYFWTSAEANLKLLINCFKKFGTDEFVPKIREWRLLLFSAAEESYEITCGQETSRQLKAFIKGWEVLHRRAKTSDNENQTQESL